MVIMDFPLEEMLRFIGPLRKVFKRRYNEKEGDEICSIPFLGEIPDGVFLCPFHFGIDNIYRHGKFPVCVTLYRSKIYKVLVLQESGQGFNFMAIQEKYTSGKKYWQNQGSGFECYNNSKVIISFEKNGTQMNLFDWSNKNHLVTSRFNEIEKRWFEK